MSFQSLEEIAVKSEQLQCPFWETVLKDDMEDRDITKEKSFAKMTQFYEAMKEADDTYDPTLLSPSKLAGGNGYKLQQAREKGEILCGELIGEVMEKAVKMGESNACMRRIVAAPTAGSCGVLPAVLLSCEKNRDWSRDKMIEALYVAAGIGQVIAKRAFISGASGGCQAEIGSASAMAAGSVAYLGGGDSECIVHAAAMALKNLLGLTCDPVAGLVEVPCINRNVIGAVNAMTSADMALAGLRSAIKPDEVIDTMRNIGMNMPSCLKETGEGGLAITPSGKEIAARLNAE